MTAYVVDCETTGTCEHDRVVEVAFVEVETGRTTAHLVNPGIPIPPEASAIHHITDDMVAGAPRTIEVPPNATLMAAHNAAFDRRFVPFAGPWVCTYKCALRLWPEAPGHSNQALRYWLKLEPELPADLAPHRAEYDALVTREICLAIREEAKRTLGAGWSCKLQEWSDMPALLARAQWGRYKGQRWSECPRSYLRWVAERDPREDVRYTARFWL